MASNEPSHSSLNVHVSWHRVTSEHVPAYCECIASSLPVPPFEAFQCAEHNCTIHHQVLESYCKSFCNTLKVSAEVTLPLARQGRVIPGGAILLVY